MERVNITETDQFDLSPGDVVIDKDCCHIWVVDEVHAGTHYVSSSNGMKMSYRRNSILKLNSWLQAVEQQWRAEHGKTAGSGA